MPLHSVQKSDEDSSTPFRFSNPKLVSQKVHSQVFVCDAFDVEDQSEILCILKFFSPKAVAAYERELAAYSFVEAFTELQEVVPLKLWSGNWVGTQYHEFLGKNLPTSLIRKSDRFVSIIALSYIHNAVNISNAPEGLRIFLVKAALHSLRRLHAARITHGDVSVQNLLIQREESSGYSVYWIDFSASTIEASPESISHEWTKALEYFSDFVPELFIILIWFR